MRNNNDNTKSMTEITRHKTMTQKTRDKKIMTQKAITQIAAAVSQIAATTTILTTTTKTTTISITTKTTPKAATPGETLVISFEFLLEFVTIVLVETQVRGQHGGHSIF